MVRTVVSNGMVFDGTGSAPKLGDVVIEGDRIVDVGTGLDGDESVDASGHLVIPGLFDCHVHFMADGNFSPTHHVTTPFSLHFYRAMDCMARTLACGITTVRDAGGADLGLKEARDQGLVPGPRMQIAINMLSQTGGHGDSWEVCGAHVPGMLDAHPGRPDPIVDGPEEMRRKVRELVRAGASVIKVATSGGVLSPRSNPQLAQFDKSELDMLVAEATAAGLFVMAHAQATDGIKNAIRAGIRSIEHGIYLDDEAIQMMLDAGTWLVPTLIAPQGVLDAADSGMDIPAQMVEKARLVAETHRESVSKAIAAGVKVAMGTDSGVTPHGQNLRELELMADLGMTPTEVLEASTRVAAELMGLDGELGTIEAGKAADLVLVRGTEMDVSDLKSRIAAVYQSGVQVFLAA